MSGVNITSGDVSSVNDPTSDQHALNVKLSRKEEKKSKRKRNDPEEAEVEAIVAEGATVVGQSDSAKAQRKKKKKNDAAALTESAAASHQAETDTPSGDKSKKKKKSKRKGKDKPQAEVPIDPQLSGDVSAPISPPNLQPQYHTYQNSMTFPMPYASGPHQYPMFPAPHVHPDSGAVAVPEALFQVLGLSSLGNNSEDISRALQNLDLSRIADVLRQLQATGSIGPLAFPGTVQSQPPQEQRETQGQDQATDESRSTSTPTTGAESADAQPTPPIGIPLPEMNASQVPVPSALILGQPLRNPPKVIKSGKVTMPSIETNDNPEHAFLLANRWLNTAKLRNLAKKTGLVYKRGKFSTVEEAIIREAIERYRVTRGMTNEQLTQLIFTKTPKGKDPSPFWSDITTQVPLRPLIAIYHYVRRAYHPLKHQGKWTPQEDAAVRAAVAELGPQWEQVSARVGRMASDCRDRWRNHLNNREARKSGPWTKEEEERLTKIVAELTAEQDADEDIVDRDSETFWAIIEERMGNERGRQQCRIKWTDALSKTVKNGGNKPRWSQQDAYILVHKIASLNVRDDSEIDWKLIPDDDWNLWSAHSLQRRWLTLKKSVKGYEEMTHQEIMDILRVKKANMPPPPVQPKKQRVTSEATVPQEVESGPIAGPSNLGAHFSTQVLDMRPVAQPVPHPPPPLVQAQVLNPTNGDGESSSDSSSSSDEDSDEESDEESGSE